MTRQRQATWQRRAGRSLLAKCLWKNCPFAQSTANLYMKIAKEWDKLVPNSRSVRNLSLREAGELLYTARSDPSSDEGGAEVRQAQCKREFEELQLLEPGALAGLSELEARTLIVELGKAYDLYGYGYENADSRLEQSAFLHPGNLC